MMRTAEIICASASYFEKSYVLDAVGEKRLMPDQKTPITIDVRKDVPMGAIVEMSDFEYDRLAKLGAVQEPGAAPLPGTTGPKPTPFSTPMLRDDYDESIVPDPAAPTAGNPLPPGGLTVEERQRLEAQAAGILETEELDVETATVAELSAWIKADKPNQAEVIDAADGDPVIAQKLLDAENEATGQKPRKKIKKELTAIIADGSEEETEDEDTDDESNDEDDQS